MGSVHRLPSRQRMKTRLPTTRSPTASSMPLPSAATSTSVCMKAMVVRAGVRARPGEEGRQVGTGLHFTPVSGGGPSASSHAPSSLCQPRVTGPRASNKNLLLKEAGIRARWKRWAWGTHRRHNHVPTQYGHGSAVDPAHLPAQLLLHTDRREAPGGS